jgi:UDP-glucuronate 4-epimerase
LAYTLHYLHGMPTSIVRFFTVYGPRGRPDMTPYVFVEAMRKRKPITLFDGGVNVHRDWTYVDDIVAGIVAALDANLPFEIFNLGNASPVQLCDFVAQLEQITGLTAIIEARPLPAADPRITYANIDKAQRLLGFHPGVAVEEGLTHFWQWYQKEVLPYES